MKNKELPKLSQANYEIMQQIWKKGEATVQEIHDSLNRIRRNKVKRETIQVQVSRLEKYGWVRRVKRGKSYYYSACQDKRETTREILTDIQDRIFGGSPAELIRCLFQNQRVPEEELNRIQKLLEKTGGDP